MKGGGALVVSLGMPMGMNTLLAINSALAQDARPPLSGEQLSTYIAVNADGTVTGFYGKMDMGHGITTAISQMIAERAGQSFSLLILDEVFGSLDEARRQNVVELLRGLQDRFEQVILITHIEQVREGLDRVINVRYDEESGMSVVTQSDPSGVDDTPLFAGAGAED